MRIIVTGGYGFIGSAFVNHIRAKHPWPLHTQILIVDKLTHAADTSNVTAPNINFLHKDICDVTAEELGEYDYLVHFAAESHVDNSIKDGKPFIRTNVEGTFNLLECARQNKSLKKFICKVKKIKYLESKLFDPFSNLISIKNIFQQISFKTFIIDSIKVFIFVFFVFIDLHKKNRIIVNIVKK